MRRASGRLASTLLIALAMGGVVVASPPSATLTNIASATYDDTSGHAYAVRSNTLRTTIAPVGALVVSPKQPSASTSDAYAQNQTVTRTFTIANTSNVADAYQVVSATSGAGRIVSIAFASGGATTPVTPGATTSAIVQPGATISVVVTVATDGVPVGTAFPIDLTTRTTAVTTANGLQSDTGRAWAKAAPGAALAGTSGPQSAIAKTVDRVVFEQSTPGASVTYRIAFTNYGGVAATHAVLSDVFPAVIHPDPASVTLDGAPAAATLAGQRIDVPLATLQPGAPHEVSIAAHVDASAAVGASFVNVATLTADGLAAVATTPASVLIGIADVVYDGYGGNAHPIAGATVTLLDAATHQPLVLPAVAGETPNAKNANPFVTGADGRYDFQILADAGSASGAVRRTASTASLPSRFEIAIAAPGYLPRRIGVAVTPSNSGALYDAVLTALDSQQLAAPGAFTLTANDVQLHDLFNVLGNLPLFAQHPISVTKTADRTTASGGDRVRFTIGFQDTGTAAVTGGTLVDALPPGLAYVPGSARLDGVAVTPVQSGRTLTFPVPAIEAAQHQLAYSCVVLPETPAGATLTNHATVRGTINGGTISGSADASISVIGGAFSDRGVITGRVFVDLAHTGRFARGDRPVGGARIVLENGESVVTDADGRFSFPGVRPGMHVLRLDPLTLPATVRLARGAAYDAPASGQRLVHGLFDTGLLQDINFALEPAP